MLSVFFILVLLVGIGIYLYFYHRELFELFLRKEKLKTEKDVEIDYEAGFGNSVNPGFNDRSNMYYRGNKDYQKNMYVTPQKNIVYNMPEETNRNENNIVLNRNDAPPIVPYNYSNIIQNKPKETQVGNVAFLPRPVTNNNQIKKQLQNNNNHNNNEIDLTSPIQIQGRSTSPTTQKYPGGIKKSPSDEKRNFGIRGSEPLYAYHSETRRIHEVYPVDTESEDIKVKSSKIIERLESNENENNKSSNDINTLPIISASELTYENRLGGGAFGQVWKGKWHGIPVAIKLLPAWDDKIVQNPNHLPPHHQSPHLKPDLHVQFKEAFYREVGLLCRLRHPNICLFLGISEDGPSPAIITELAVNGSLWDALRRDNIFEINNKTNSWPINIIHQIIKQTASALSYLHSHKPPIIHRDLKSPNLLLDESLNIKVCDFGLARFHDTSENAIMTSNCGTVFWMAPEIISGSNYTEKTDVYSFAIVIWELLTRQCPYDGLEPVQVAFRVVHQGFRPDLPNWCPRKLRTLIIQCWDSNPSVRPSFQTIVSEIGDNPNDTWNIL